MIVHIEVEVTKIDGEDCDEEIIKRALSDEFHGFDFDVDDSVYTVTNVDYVNQPD